MHGFRVCTPQKMRNTTMCLSLYFQSCQENHVRVKKPHTGEFRLRRWALCCWGTNYPQNLKGVFAKSPNWACFHLICSIKSTTLCSLSYVGGTNWTFYWWRSFPNDLSKTTLWLSLFLIRNSRVDIFSSFLLFPSVLLFHVNDYELNFLYLKKAVDAGEITFCSWQQNCGWRFSHL